MKVNNISNVSYTSKIHSKEEKRLDRMLACYAFVNKKDKNTQIVKQEPEDSEKFYSNGKLWLERYSNGAQIFYYDSGDVWVRKYPNGQGCVYNKDGSFARFI